MNEGGDVINIKALKSILIISNEEELQKVLESNKLATAPSEALKDETFNLGHFNLKLRDEAYKEKLNPSINRTKSKACIMQ